MSRAQATRVAVTVAPVAPTTYFVQLPHNGTPRQFAFQATAGQTTAQVAAGLLEVLLDQQTVYSVAIDPLAPSELMIVGPLAETFAVTVAAGMTQTLVQTAIVGFPSRGRLIVVLAESLYGLPPREFATRTVPEGVLETRNVLSVREEHSGDIFEIDSRLVRTTFPPG